MNIKEIEERSGLTRANIRYYEQEGLIAPVRRENKYRDYSEEDLETLLRIALVPVCLILRSGYDKILRPEGIRQQQSL